VTVRFSTGGYSYKVYSWAKRKNEGDAGVIISDAKGKLLSDIACNERPLLYIEYLKTALPCDPLNPRGEAGCRNASNIKRGK
jgi:hypothetical protein